MEVQWTNLNYILDSIFLLYPPHPLPDLPTFLTANTALSHSDFQKEKEITRKKKTNKKPTKPKIRTNKQKATKTKSATTMQNETKAHH